MECKSGVQKPSPPATTSPGRENKPENGAKQCGRHPKLWKKWEGWLYLRDSPQMFQERDNVYVGPGVQRAQVQEDGGKNTNDGGTSIVKP